jgi:uncharacterized RDD family membrane protein YckC
VTFPDPYTPGAGQEAIQPPPNQGYNPPPADLSYNQANQGYNPPPPSPGFTPAPPVPAAYGYGQYPASAVPQGMYFDPVSGLALPEGTQLANVGRRIGAWFLTVPLIIVTLGLGYIVWGLIVWGNGQTPALQVLGMRCWRPETNRVPGFWFMALREIPGRIIDHLLNFITLITSFVLFLAGKEHKALHDYIAGTVVLYDPNKVLAS